MRPYLVLVIALLTFGVFYCSNGNSADKDAQGKDSRAPMAKDARGNEPPQKQTSSSQVTVYITSWCPACRMTIDFLKKEGIPYTVKDIEKDPAYLKEMIEKAGGNRGVPVIDINGKILLGFNPYRVKELLR
jgi:glutaredoxin